MLRFILILLCIYIALHLWFREKPIDGETVIISHRGAAGLAPENTLSAIEEGLKETAFYIEVDAQKTLDDLFILMHDTDVSRTTNGQGSVASLTWEDVSKLDAGSHFSPEFQGEPVPTLASALELIKASPATLLLELKSSGEDIDIENGIASLLTQHEVEDKVIVISFDTELLIRFHRLMPNVPVAAVYLYPTDLPRETNLMSVDVFWTSVIFDPFLIYRMHKNDHKVWVWTVNNSMIMRMMLWMGVDGITTDRPDILRELLERS